MKSGLEEMVEWLIIQDEPSIKNGRVFDNYTAGVKDAFHGSLEHARALLAEEQTNKPVEDEPLEELAKRKGHRLELAGWLYRQDGSLVVQRAENMAALRAYLNGLDDKGETK